MFENYKDLKEEKEKELLEMIDIARRQIGEHSETLRNCERELQELKKNKR